MSGELLVVAFVSTVDVGASITVSLPTEPLTVLEPQEQEIGEIY